MNMSAILFLIGTEALPAFKCIDWFNWHVIACSLEQMPAALLVLLEKLEKSRGRNSTYTTRWNLVVAAGAQ